MQKCMFFKNILYSPLNGHVQCLYFWSLKIFLYVNVHNLLEFFSDKILITGHASLSYLTIYFLYYYLVKLNYNKNILVYN